MREVPTAGITGVALPAQSGSGVEELRLRVAERKILGFERKRQIAAVAELVWNALDANATEVEVALERTDFRAISRIIVRDNGNGMSYERACNAFSDFGESWKTGRRQTEGPEPRLMHGRNGEGRLYVFALGDRFTWESAWEEAGHIAGVRITGSADHAILWHVNRMESPPSRSGTTVWIEVPQGKPLRGLDSHDSAANLTARLAFYLLAYPSVKVVFDGKLLNAADIMAADPIDLPLTLPAEYADDSPAPLVTFVEWKSRLSERNMLICDSDGLALFEHGRDWTDSVVSFTPYLRSARFNEMPADELLMLPMTHGALLDAAETAIRDHLARRSAQISSEVVQQLKNEGIYPYQGLATTKLQEVERQTFDVVVTCARHALPEKLPARKLSVGLIQSALESSPGDLHKILNSVLALNADDQRHLANLLDSTNLSHVIGAATTVTNRLNFIGGLRKILADDILRKELREVDQLHPMIAANLWLFGEDWSMASTEVGLTNVLRAHLNELGDEVVLENELDTVLQPDGRTGRVDVLLFRSRRSDQSTERIVIELKRPTVCVGKKELDQVKGYARAVIDNPQYKGVDCAWHFYLITYDYSDKIERDIRQMGKPAGLADDQPDYQVWVKSWGEILDAAEKKLLFFQRQLNYEATDERVVSHLRESYAHFIPDSLHSTGH